MAKVGYIFKANHYDTYEADKEWMLNFGCEQIIEEETDHEVMRPQWKFQVQQCSSWGAGTVGLHRNVPDKGRAPDFHPRQN